MSLPRRQVNVARQFDRLRCRVEAGYTGQIEIRGIVGRSRVQREIASNIQRNILTGEFIDPGTLLHIEIMRRLDGDIFRGNTRVELDGAAISEEARGVDGAADDRLTVRPELDQSAGERAIRRDGIDSIDVQGSYIHRHGVVRIADCHIVLRVDQQRGRWKRDRRVENHIARIPTVPSSVKMKGAESGTRRGRQRGCAAEGDRAAIGAEEQAVNRADVPRRRIPAIRQSVHADERNVHRAAAGNEGRIAGAERDAAELENGDTRGWKCRTRVHSEPPVQIDLCAELILDSEYEIARWTIRRDAAVDGAVVSRRSLGQGRVRPSGVDRIG